MPKCRLRHDVRFSRAEITALLEQLAVQFQYDDTAGIAPNRVLMRCYDKMQYRLQQNERRDYVVHALQTQSQTTPEKEGLGGSSLKRTANSTSFALRHLQQRFELGRKKRGFYS